MSTKRKSLNLTFDPGLIEEAKKLADKQHLPLSRWFEQLALKEIKAQQSTQEPQS